MRSWCSLLFTISKRCGGLQHRIVFISAIWGSSVSNQVKSYETRIVSITLKHWTLKDCNCFIILINLVKLMYVHILSLPNGWNDHRKWFCCTDSRLIINPCRLGKWILLWNWHLISRLLYSCAMNICHLLRSSICEYILFIEKYVNVFLNRMKVLMFF